MVPIPPEPESPGEPVQPLPPGMVWPPIRPEWPDRPELGNKALALAYIFVSGHGSKLRWVVVDLDELPSLPKPPAGGIGRPPTRPTPNP